MIKISIIVPVFNTEKYLKKCLDSLLNQTLREIEIICVDDGSFDNSLLLLKDYAIKDERVVVVSQKNSGQAAARNNGIKIAKGEYLGFVDSDDWVDLDYFENLYNAAKEYGCEMACAGYKRCRCKYNGIRKSYKAKLICTTTNDKVRLDNLPADNYIWNKIYLREAWNKLGLEFQQGRFFEDTALIIKILHKLGKMVTVPNTYYNYRANSESTVAQMNIKKLRDKAWAQKEMVTYAEENNIDLDITNQLQKKEYIKFLGLTMMKIYYYENLIKYNLFGFLPIGKRVIM